MTNMNETEIRMYSAICSHDGIKAREIAKETGTDKTQINRLLYSAPLSGNFAMWMMYSAGTA